MKVTDPVCGKKIDIDRATGTFEHEGWLYFFCSDECQRLFEAKPDRWETHAHETKKPSAESEGTKGGDQA